MRTTYNKISYFGFNLDCKSTYHFLSYIKRYVISVLILIGNLPKCKWAHFLYVTHSKASNRPPTLKICQMISFQLIVLIDIYFYFMKEFFNTFHEIIITCYLFLGYEAIAYTRFKFNIFKRSFLCYKISCN